MSNYKYDLAISFLKEDEGLAKQIGEKIGESYSVFIYSERQRELAGTDGEISFRRVFGEESRYVLVLYRPGWGESQWTRVEAEAIRERTASEGFDFFKLLMIETKFQAPKWVPKHQIWISYERFGLKEVLAVLDCRLQELGAEPQLETPQTIAERLKRRQAYQQLREQIRESREAVDLFRKHFESVSLLLQIETEKIKQIDPSLTISVKMENREIKIDHGAINTTLYFINQYGNVIGDESGMHVIFGERPGIWETDSYGRGPRKLREEEFLYEYFEDGKWYWLSERKGLKFTDKSFSEYILKEFLKIVEDRRDRQSKNKPTNFF